MRYFFTSFILLFPHPAAASGLKELTLKTADVQAANQGKIVVHVWRDETREDRAIDVLGVLNIKATPDVLWNVMTDCARSEVIVPKMESCEVIEKEPEGLWDIREQRTKVNFLISHTSRFRSDYDPFKSIKISRAGGDMRVQDGLWTLKGVGDGVTRLTYRAASAPSFPISRSKMIQTSRKSLPIILANLRREAEADFTRSK